MYRPDRGLAPAKARLGHPYDIHRGLPTVPCWRPSWTVGGCCQARGSPQQHAKGVGGDLTGLRRGRTRAPTAVLAFRHTDSHMHYNITTWTTMTYTHNHAIGRYSCLTASRVVGARALGRPASVWAGTYAAGVYRPVVGRDVKLETGMAQVGGRIATHACPGTRTPINYRPRHGVRRMEGPGAS